MFLYRLSITEVKQLIFSRLQLKSDFVISILDDPDLFTFNNEADLLVWSKESLYVKSNLFQFLK